MTAPTTADFAIHTERLCRAFGEFRAVEELDLDVRRGSLFALLGPNGAGKSTTIQILTTLMRPTSGRAFVAGHDVELAPRDVRRKAGVVFQDVSLDDRLTAQENLMLHAAIFGVPAAERRERVRARLAWIGLEAAASQRIRTFSGGMRRRLEIARALLHEPEVLILDEPTVGLDPQTRRVVWDNLAEIAASGDRAVFVTTHYMDEAERCDDVAILDHGRLIARGTPAELVARAGAERLVVRCDDDARAEAIAKGLGLEARATERGVEIRGDRAEAMLARLADKGLAIKEIAIVRPRLEDAFVALTGRDMRDAHDDGGHAAMRTNLKARGRR